MILAQAIEVPEIFRSLGVAGGVLAFLFISGIVTAGYVANDWKSRYDNERAKSEAKDKYIIEEIVPLLTQLVPLLAQVVKTMERHSRERDG